MKQNTNPSHLIPNVIVRGGLSVIGALIGLFGGQLLMKADILTGRYNLIYLMLVGLLGGYLASVPAAKRFNKLWDKATRYLKRVPPQAVLAAIIGATTALIITVLLNSLLEAVPGFTWYWSLLITVLLVTAFSWFFVVNRNLFNIRPNLTNTPSVITPEPTLRPKAIDTSAIIDGRIMDVIDANFIDSPILIPKFVLNELQNIADSSDPLRRNRGRRGLEVLDKIVQQKTIETQVITKDFPDVTEVDEKLIHLCKEQHADLITTDYNLSRVAALQGIKVLNVNQLANAVKAMFLPGERLSMHIVKEGREQGQGLAYLEDGTMVVVEDSGDLVGKTVDVIVTSNLQTNMGRMIFAKPDR